LLSDLRKEAERRKEACRFYRFKELKAKQEEDPGFLKSIWN
jgi:hypothetical protein